MDLYSILLTIHVICGFSALLFGLGPMVTKKGGRLHVQLGRVYFYTMFGVFLTSSLMFCFKPDHLLFLFLIGVFSFYNTFTGSRAVLYKKVTKPIAKLDWIVATLVAMAGVAMIGLGGYNILLGKTGLAILYIVFGSICTSLSFSDLRFFYKQQKGIAPLDPKHWLYKHIIRMGGSYIATFTAFCVVNNTILPGLIAWLAPGVIGGILIGSSIKKLKKSNSQRLKI